MSGFDKLTAGRWAKQAIYGFFYLLILALIAAWAYFAFIRPAPSCTNDRQDAGEEGVDCGGTCAASCLPAGLADLRATETKVFHPAGGTVSALAKIQNPNLQTAARFDYEFNFYGADNNLILSRLGSSYIYAGEIKYLTAFVVEGTAAGAKRVEFAVLPPDWLPEAEFKKPELAILNRSASAAENGIRVNGRVANRDTLLLPRVEIVAVFYDRYGFSAGISKTELDDLAPGETREFVVSHPAITAADLSKTEYFIYARRPR